MNSPYQVREIICLETFENRAVRRKLQVRIEELYQPCTLSCVMQVSLIDYPADTPKAVLKLYDWRYAAQLREDNEIDPWTDEHERAYIDFVRSGQARAFIDKLRNDEDYEEPEEGWNIAENEAYLYNTCTDMFRAETAVYGKLSAYQSRNIPQLLAAVTLDIESAYERISNEHGISCAESSHQESVLLDVDHVRVNASNFGLSDLSDLSQVYGILIEHIDGFTLSNITQYAAKTSWQAIVDQAIQTVHLLSDNAILNRDVRASNIMVSPKTDGEFRVFMIDFGQCTLRGNESDLEWGRAKWSQDEEGAIGVVMKRRLGEQGFELEYEPSLRFLEWAEGEKEFSA